MAGLAEGWELDEREVAVLELAARQADDLERLERAIEDRGAFVVGSTGQDVINPRIPEARQARAAIGRLLGQLEVPDAEEEPRSAAGKRAQRAAWARWDRQERVRQIREARRGAA